MVATLPIHIFIPMGWYQEEADCLALNRIFGLIDWRGVLIIDDDSNHSGHWCAL